MAEETFYIVVDIETDGPVPGRHAIRNLSAVATDHLGSEIGSFTVNLAAPAGTSPDPSTLTCWQDFEPDIWSMITTDPQAIGSAMSAFGTFVQCFEGDRIFVGHPLAFDGLWLSHYMQEILGQGLMAFHGVQNLLFFGAGIDLPSFVAGTLGIDYALCRHGRYPAVAATNIPHTHHGLDDARGHADVLRKTLAVIAKRNRD
ncbi:hypothetical protein OAI26_00930 [Sulfitobacter sp.]|nr:hypothetical protein [Sulfitobacter sp.]